jgi:F0F1-type ATP synthase assembly protein I
MLLAVAPLLVRRKEVKSYTDLLYCKDRGHEESVVSLCAYLLMFALLGVSMTVSPVIYYLLFIFPVAMMVYICCRRPFQSKWMRAAYFVNCFCIFIMLVYNLMTISYEDTVYYLPFGSLITIMVDWIFNLVVWGREAYVICKYILYDTGTEENAI